MVGFNDGRSCAGSFLENGLLLLIGTSRCDLSRVLTSNAVCHAMFFVYICREWLLCVHWLIGTMISLNHDLQERSKWRNAFHLADVNRISITSPEDGNRGQNGWFRSNLKNFFFSGPSDFSEETLFREREDLLLFLHTLCHGKLLYFFFVFHANSFQARNYAWFIPG